MKRRRVLVFPLLFALLLALAASGCSAAPHASGGVLRIGVRSDIPDLGYQNPDSGRFYGLEIDIAEEMARRMGAIRPSWWRTPPRPGPNCSRTAP